MSSPQVENGYTRIANEIIDVLASTKGLGGSYGQVAFAVIRKTYGWNKKEDEISISQLCEVTNLSKRTVIYSLQELESRKIIIVKRTFKNGLKHTNNICFNKNYDEWVVQNSAPQVKKNRIRAKKYSAKLRTIAKGIVQNSVGVVQNSVKKVKSFAHTKDTTKDTTITIEDKSSKKEKIYNPLGAEIIKEFETIDPKNKGYYGNKGQRAACDFLIEEYGMETVSRVIKLLPKTNKISYFPVITTPFQLKDKWTTLKSRLEQKKGEKITKSTPNFIL